MKLEHKSKFNYAWVIVITCIAMEFMALGFCSSNKSLYLAAITEALSIPRSLFSINDSCRFLITAVANLFFGTLLHKFGVRKLVGLGFLSLAASMLVYSAAEAVWVFYIGGCLLGLGLTFTGTTMASYMVRRWCTKNVGTVQGLVLASNGLGGAVAAQIVSPIIYEEGNAFGYRNAYMLVAALLVVVGVLAVVFLKEPEGGAQVQPGKKKKPRGEGWVGMEYEDAVKKPYFYPTLIAIFLTGAVISSVNGISAAHMKDVGLDTAYVATVLSAHSLALTAFKFLTGVCYDKFGLKVSMSICQVAAVVVFVLLALMTNSPSGKVFAMIFGIFSSLALPLETVMLSFITSDMFGNRSFAKMLGIISALNTAGYAVGSPAVNICYDTFGTYVPAIWASAGIMAALIVAFRLILKRNAKDKEAILAEQTA